MLVTVAMAYEGLDAPETAVVAALTHIRSRPWLEQMVARATRVDPFAGAWEEQRALVYHPDDLLFRRFRERMETEQGTLARHSEGPPPARACPSRARPGAKAEPGIVPLASNALGAALRDAWRPAPTSRRGGGRRRRAEAQADLLDPPSVLRAAAAAPHRRDGGGAGGGGRGGAAPAARGAGGGNYHRLNAVLKRVLGKGRGEMGAAELDAAVAWLERNRLADHLHLLEGDGRYAFEARRRAGQWRPPQGGRGRWIGRRKPGGGAASGGAASPRGGKA